MHSLEVNAELSFLSFVEAAQEVIVTCICIYIYNSIATTFRNIYLIFFSMWLQAPIEALFPLFYPVP